MKSYFPIKIRITDGENKGKILIVDHHEIPNGITFVVLETNVDFKKY